jgi:hypothetical protein
MRALLTLTAVLLILAAGCARPRASATDEIPSGSETARKASEAAVRSEESDQQSVEYLSSSEHKEEEEPGTESDDRESQSNPYRDWSPGASDKSESDESDSQSRDDG